MGAGHWRPMRPGDLILVAGVAEAVHPGYPEAAGVFAERLHLYPAGCRILDTDHGIQGYAIGHPWRDGSPPPLDSGLGNLPARPELFYIHDIALMPAERGRGHGAVVVDQLARVAVEAGLPAMALVAVSGSTPFWQQRGFTVVDDPVIQAALASYGESARFMLRRLSPLPASTS